MQLTSRFSRALAAGAGLVLSTVAVAAIAVHIDDSVPSANPRAGSPANVIIDDYKLVRIAQGADPLENPVAPITTFGFLADGTKTEADENLYLEFKGGLSGPTPGYDYGHHFLFQGHENGGGKAYVTRINLDVKDPLHRITLLTPPNQAGSTGFSSIDGSTWDPFTKTMLFTQESASTNGVIEITPSWPPSIHTLETIVGKGGFEGIHPDGNGDLLLIEDAGGTSVNVVPADPTSPKTARQPNSFVFKFHPYERTNLLAGGTLYALKVWINGTPITFHSADPSGDTFSDLQLKLHTPGTSWPVEWVKVHDNSTDGFVAYSANAAAKTAGATPFKRPENAQFQPDSDFLTFFFDPTGDTDAFSGGQPALAARGVWGSIFRVDLERHNPVGTISIEVLGDAAHASFDNLAFADRCTLLAAEDRGDGLHEQLNRLDSVWAFDVCGHHPKAPRRLIALGRDAVATAVSEAGGEGDNEPTGLQVSDGDTSVRELLGRQLETHETRWFITEQHGNNQVFEILPAEHGEGHERFDRD